MQSICLTNKRANGASISQSIGYFYLKASCQKEIAIQNFKVYPRHLFETCIEYVPKDLVTRLSRDILGGFDIIKPSDSYHRPDGWKQYQSYLLDHLFI